MEDLKTNTFPQGTILGTLDVKSLYTNIPHTEGLEANRGFLNKRIDQVVPTGFITRLMEFVLKNNNFTFNNEHYLQTQGTAMGTKMAPSYACLFMGDLELKLLHQSNHKPDLWIRFIDDIFFIWTHGQEKWNSFFEYLNSFHNSIKFTSEISTQSVPFLDVEVKLVEGKIETDLYTKPTDCHNYLQWSSCHPRSTKKGIPFSQALRLRRICSNEIDFTKRLHMLEGYFRKGGYPLKYIIPPFLEVKSMPRLTTLDYKEHEENSRVTFPITYHPNLRNLQKTVLEKYNNILLRDPENKKIFKDPPMVSYRRCKNLQAYLTRSSLIRRSVANLVGFSNCFNPKCASSKFDLHKYNVPGNTFISSVTKESFPITQSLNCESHNIIYLVTCTKCYQQYVGETGRKHQDRAPEHVRSINTDIKKISKNSQSGRINSPVSRHFSQNNHNASHFSIQIIEKCKKKTQLTEKLVKIFGS